MTPISARFSDHIDYLDANSELRTLSWDIDQKRYSCGLIEIDSFAVALPQRIFDTLVSKPNFTPTLRELVLRCYVPGYTLGKASCLLRQRTVWAFPTSNYSDFFQTGI